MDNNLEERYKEGKLNGMFEAYDVIDSAIVKLRHSLDTVWQIHDEEDSLDKSSQEYKDRLTFATNTLFVLRTMFQDDYDAKIDEIKAGMEEYRDAF
jgi:hypothetical protein